MNYIITTTGGGSPYYQTRIPDPTYYYWTDFEAIKKARAEERKRFARVIMGSAKPEFDTALRQFTINDYDLILLDQGKLPEGWADEGEET